MMFLAAIGGFLRRVPGWLWLAAGLFVAFWLYGHWQFGRGEDARQAKVDKAMAKAAAEIEHLKAEASKITTVVETKYIDRVKTVTVKGDTIVQKVPVYISRDLPELPGAWRVLHDAAAQNAIPEAFDPVNGAPVAPADAAATVAENYKRCHINAERLIALQDWVAQQQAMNPE